MTNHNIIGSLKRQNKFLKLGGTAQSKNRLFFISKKTGSTFHDFPRQKKNKTLVT